MPAPSRDDKIQPWIGKYIGNYRLVRLLGEGSMGMVFEGVHDGVGGRAAIKILRPEITGREDIAARFFNEARAANAGQHPGIVRIFDSGYTPEGVAFLCMEYLDGQSLRARLLEVKKFPIRDALRVGKQIASALLAAHRKNIIHRDLKPDNIMLVQDPDLPGGERVKILDFGVAKITENLGAMPMNTRTGMVLGTPIYMAPEQCRGAKGVTDRSDVYSLGVILYRLLAGRPPFLSQSTGDLLAMHLMDAVPPLQQHTPSVGANVATLVYAMLDKVPLQRPSMESVVEQLQALEKDPGAVVPEPADPTTTSVATEIHGVVAAPTVRAPVIRASAEAVTTPVRIMPKKRGPRPLHAAANKNFLSRMRPALWIGLLVLVVVAVLGSVFLLRSGSEEDHPGVDIRHPAASGGHAGPATAISGH